MPSKPGRGVAKRRVIVLLCCLIALVVVLARVQMAYAGAGGSIGGGGGGGGWMDVFYKTVYVMDDSGFVQDGANPSQGWNKDSIDYFWNLLDNEVRTNTLPGYSPRVVAGGTTSNELMYNAIDGNSKRWVDGSWAIPKKVFYALATQAIDRAAARAGTSRARIVAFGCIYGGNSGTREWQFLNVSANLQAQNGFFYTLLPDGSPASLTLNDRVAPTGQLAKGLIPPEYMSGVTGTLWDTEAGIDAGDGNIGSNPGENWRDYTYRRAVTDAGNALGTVAFIAVADNEPAVHNGSLTIGKAVTGQGASTTDAFKFDVHLTDSAGNGVNGTYGGHTFSGGWCSVIASQAAPVTISDIPAGLRYTVTEDTTYNTKYSLQGIENATGTIASGATSTVTVTNARCYGQLDVKKVAIGTDGASAGIRSDARWQFNVKIYDDNGGLWKNEDFTLARNEVKSFGNIPTTYTYAVTEAADNFYDSSIANATGTIASGVTSTATATNTRRYGRLDVKKIAIGTDGASAGVRADARWRFNVKIYDDNGGLWKNEDFTFARNEVKSFENIPTTYTYAVTEAADNLYDISIANATGIIGHNATSTATATNTRRYGRLDVKKIAIGTDGASAGVRSDARWQFNVKIYDDYGNVWKNETFWLARNQVKSFERIPTTYTYAVTETADALYDTTIANATGIIAHNTISTATATNNRRYGRLDVKKIAHGTDENDSGLRADARWLFNVKIYDDYGNVWKNETFWLARNQVKSFERIPTTYTYAVTETADVLYDTTIANATGTIAHNVTSTATATNNRRYGRLDVKKIAIGTDGASVGIRVDARWQFNVKIYDDDGNVWKNETFWLTRNEVKSFERIPTTYTYQVTETPNILYDTSITNPSGTIQHNVTSTAITTNTRRYGNLRVRKVAYGTDANDSGLRSDARWHFNVVIRDDYGNVWKNESFWLTRNEERIIEHIPTTYTYTVTEDADDFYDTSIDNAKNYIRHNNTQTATATNNRRYGQLEVKKTARGTDVADSGIRPDERWEFRVMILDDDGRAWKDETFWLTRNETKRFERIPTTYTYRVFESEHPLYDSSSTGEAGVIANRETSKANFENQRRHGRLEVRKRANGTDASDSGVEADAKWRFDVTIRDDYGNTWKHASFLLARDEVRAFEDIPTTYTYEVSESADSQYETTWNDRTGMIEKNTTSSCIATNRRLEGSFVVRKVVDRSRITDKTLDADRAFEIRVSLNDDKRRPVSGTYGEMTFVNGECVLRLKDGEARVATDVPTDWTWGVREIAPDQYTLSGIENRTGAVEDNKRTQVVVTNEQLPGWSLVNKVTR